MSLFRAWLLERIAYRRLSWRQQLGLLIAWRRTEIIYETWTGERE